MNIFKVAGKLFLLCSALLCNSSLALEMPFPPKIQAIVDDLSRDKLWTRTELEKVFSNVKLLPKVVKAIKRPAERLPWFKYRKLFINDRVINNGVRFAKQHQTTLKRAADEYGVPAEIIVAILGVETRYGTNTGKFRIIDSLTTLTLDYPRRSEFFSSELKHFLRLVGEEQLDVLSLKGSYAGAMGVPQFIASSYRHYAVDFDHDSTRDLLQSVDDAIGSVANYLSEHKWRADRPVYKEVSNVSNNSDLASMVSDGLKPVALVQKLKKAGVKLPESLQDRDGASLVKLKQSSGNAYRAVFDNFYVITRYNRSINYAMTVAQLANHIKDRLDKENG